MSGPNGTAQTKTKPPDRYDYSQPGCYFITICTKEKKKILSEIEDVPFEFSDGNGKSKVGAAIGRPPRIQLTRYGKIVEEAIRNIPKCYTEVDVDKYVIMPNHVHMILIIKSDENGRPMAAPTIATVINQFKGYVTKKAGKTIWQKLFHDHIIRNEKDYQKIWMYIELNPPYWKRDSLYLE